MPGKMSWFLPENPDVLGTLRQQASVTMEGMAALVEWANGDPAASDRLRDAEHRADDLKRDAARPAQDRVHHADRRRGPLRDVGPARRGPQRGEGRRPRVGGHGGPARPDRGRDGGLPRRGRPPAGRGVRSARVDATTATARRPTDAADKAVKAQRQLERVYRQGMSALLEVSDLREVIGDASSIAASPGSATT